MTTSPWFQLLPMIVFWISIALFSLLPRMRVLQRYKFPQEETSRNSVDSVAVYWNVLFHHTIQVVLYWLLSLPTDTSTGLGSVTTTSTRPVAARLWQLGVYIAVDETYSYWFHRTMHRFTWLYRHIHMHHHQVINVFPAASQYSSLLDMVLGIWLPNILASSISGLPPSWIVWLLTIRTIKVNYDHLGYLLPFPWNPFALHFPGWNAPLYHHLHHTLRGRRHNLSNGFTNLWDLVAGTSMHE